MKTQKKFILLTIIALISLHPIKAYNLVDDYRDFGKKHPYPYLEFNIKIIALIAVQLLKTLRSLQSEHCFTDVDKKEASLIKKVAKELNFSQKSIDGLQIKKPVLYSYFDQMFRNNYAAFFKTIIIGRQDHKILAPIEEEPNVKKFTYAHELSHIKYQHSVKILLYTLISPLVIHGLMTGLSKLLQKRTKNVNLNNFAPKINFVPKILESWITKFAVQISLLLLMQKKFEKDADVGATSLGQEVTKGGIRYFETLAKLEKENHNKLLNYFDNVLIKYFLKLTLGIKNLFHKIIDPHASHEKRAQYLNKILEKQKKIKN